MLLVLLQTEPDWHVVAKQGYKGLIKLLKRNREMVSVKCSSVSKPALLCPHPAHEMASRPLAQFDLILAWRLVGNCCERLKIIMECTNIQFCEWLGHGWQFHPLHIIHFLLSPQPNHNRNPDLTSFNDVDEQEVYCSPRKWYPASDEGRIYSFTK